jgi:glucose dehydrogenase
MGPRWMACAVLACSMLPALHAQTGKSIADADWPMFNRDLAGTCYSPLSQIKTSNIVRLTLAWSDPFRQEGKKLVAPSLTEIFHPITPIVVNGVKYLPAGDQVVALDPETGKEI